MILSTYGSATPLLNIEDLRAIAGWAAHCAEKALPVLEANAPADERPRAAVMAARDFALTGTRTGHLRKIAWAANAAAREIGDPAAAAAARSASAAAGSAYTHPIATPHQTTHILASAAYAAEAIARRAIDEAGTREAELRRAIERAPASVRQIVTRFPARLPSKARFHMLLYRLDAGLRL